MIVTVWPFPGTKRMSVFTVHELPEPPADRIDRAEAMVFLKDGFSWGAFLFGPFWLAAKRLWLPLAVYVAVASAAGFAIWALELGENVQTLLYLGLNLVLAFEAHALEVSSLEARGWSTLGSVSGHGRLECERRFFEGWLPSEPVLRRRSGETSGMPAAALGALGAASSAGSRRSGAGFLGKLGLRVRRHEA